MKILNYDEKMLMFGLVDKEMRENINQLKKLVGIKSPAARKKREIIAMSSVASSTKFTEGQFLGKKTGGRNTKNIKILTL